MNKNTNKNKTENINMVYKNNVESSLLSLIDYVNFKF